MQTPALSRRVLPLLPAALALFAGAPAIAQWTTDPATNTLIAGASGDQVQPKIVAWNDTLTIAWFDNQTGGYDVRVQRYSNAGIPQWTPGGVLVADRAVSSTQDYDLVIDDGGNTYITFNDDSQTPGAQQISVHKLSPSGGKLWGNAGVQLTTGSTFRGPPAITLSSDGFVFVGYSTALQNFTLHKLEPATGAPAPGFLSIGLTINESGRSMALNDLQPGLDGSVIALWNRGGGTNYATSTKHIYAQRYSPIGAALWNSAQPVIVFNGSSLGNGYFPTATSDGAGGIVVGFYEGGGSRNAYVQHVLASGGLRFESPVSATGATPGRIRVGASATYDPRADVYYLAGIEVNASPQTDYRTFVQKVSATGDRLFGDLGVTLIPQGTPNQPSFVQTALGASGAFVFAIDSRSATTGIVFGSRVRSDGSVVFSQEVSSLQETKSRLNCVSTPDNMAYVVFGAGAGALADIKAQSVSASGVLGPLTCQSVDYNDDGVFPDDQDLADFLSELGGGPRPLGAWPDFNRDGVYPDDSDVTALLRVLGGGACAE